MKLNRLKMQHDAKLILIFALLSFYFSFQAHGSNDEYLDLNIQIKNNCLISLKNQHIKLSYIVSSKSGLNFFEKFECFGNSCSSERIYFDKNRLFQGVHKFNTQLLDKIETKNLYSISFEGSDSYQKRKISIDLISKKLIITTFGKTITNQKEYTESENSDCRILEVIR